jgi:hypothetical protein
VTDWDDVNRQILERFGKIEENPLSQFHQWPEVRGTMIDGRPREDGGELAIVDAWVRKHNLGVDFSTLFDYTDTIVGKWNAYGTLLRQACVLALVEEYVMALDKITHVYEVGGGIGLMGWALDTMCPNLIRHYVFDLEGPSTIQHCVWDWLFGEEGNTRKVHTSQHDIDEYVKRLDFCSRDGGLFISLCALSEMPVDERGVFDEFAERMAGIVVYQPEWFEVDNTLYFVEHLPHATFVPRTAMDNYHMCLWGKGEAT